MLSNDTIDRKPTITVNGVVMLDLTQPSFNWANPLTIDRTIIVSEDLSMRTDSIAKLLYGDAGRFDWVCKTNGISNPFSLNTGDIIYVAIPDEMGDALVDNTQQSSTSTDAASFYFDITKLSQKDANRLNFIKQKSNTLANGAKSPVPPNVADPGDKEITRKNGKVYFGSDVVAGAENCPTPLSKATLKAKLIQNKLFGNLK
jgi:hypothetical protein